MHVRVAITTSGPVSNVTVGPGPKMLFLMALISCKLMIAAFFYINILSVNIMQLLVLYAS